MDFRALHGCRIICCLIVGLALGGVAASPPQKGDPFAESNKANAAPAPPEKPPVVKPPAARRNPTDDRIDFEVSVSPKQVRRGETVRLTITGIPRPGYHTYPLTQRLPNQVEAQLSTILYKNTPGIQPLWPVTESPPTTEFVKELNESYLEHKEKFTWTQDLLVLPEATPGPAAFRFTVALQVCDEQNCVSGEHNLEAGFEVSNAPALALSADLQKRLQAKRPEIEVISELGAPSVAPPNRASAPQPDSTKALQPAAKSPPDVPAPAAPVKGAEPKTAESESDLWTFLLHGMLWGAISLLTPCVFPMIPITVSFFLKQAEKEHHRPWTMAAVYSGTIIVVLTVGGLVLMKSLQGLSQHWATNFILGGLFLVFALSLFGMYDIQLPSSLANLTSSHEGQGGLVGTMFMALTFTIISFACVAPFYGGFIALSAAATTVGAWVKLALGALAFSVTFASPFFVLALFPTLLRTLPKSGSWLNTIKVVMGFLEMAAALKFLRAGELNLYGKADFLTYDMVLGIYVALTLLCGLYLLSLYRLPHDHEPVAQLGVPRLLFSLLFLSLAFYLLPGLFKTAGGEQQRPNGTVFNWLDSFLLPDAAEPLPTAVAGPSRSDGERLKVASRLAWIGDLQKGLQDAQQRRRLVFIDFTGLT